MAISRKITIDPITRIEGHGKVTIHLDEEGNVAQARFHVTQFRGYERFCHGRPLEEMPVITQRICGICPVSHHLASAKACDAIMGVEIPRAASLLRELLHMGQYIQSHALHFFHLASPDLLLGWDSDPPTRNIVGVVRQFPQVALMGIRLRKFGQEIIQALGGKKIHPAFAVPGGVSERLSIQNRDRLLKGFHEATEAWATAMGFLKKWWHENLTEANSFASFSSGYAGLVDEMGNLALYDGKIRFCGPKGEALGECHGEAYLDFIGEMVEPWSYLKFPFLKALGYPGGIYRVGPLARLNVCQGVSTPKAQEELEELRSSAPRWPAEGSLLYHWCRLVELIYALERAKELLEDEEICSKETRITYSKPAKEEGVGVVEAPRGTLIHHYRVDEHGVIKDVNLIVATGHNNLAMNEAVKAVAKAYIHRGQITEGILNRIEGAIRCYDPCLSCSTHAVGQMPLIVTVYDSGGEKIGEITRSIE